jgi:gamma-glutamyltranspeptidase/glutathione hydrolase
VSLAPSKWPAAEREHWLNLESQFMPGNPPARGQGGAVATTHHAFATRVGLEALKQGGSAVDAVLASSLAQITLGLGDHITFFGILGLMHHDSRSGETLTLHAGWKTCREERDPLSIPSSGLALTNDVRDMVSGLPNGRAILVGGFMKAVEVAHARFGKLPFARLFDASIELAEEGFPLSEKMAMGIDLAQRFLWRLPETRRLFFRADGKPCRAGERFRQPALAATLRAVAEHGSAYMYTGPWARRCVEAVRREGGRMTLQDLADYEVGWVEPHRTRRHGYQVALVGAPNAGSISLIEALNLADAAGIRARGHWSHSAESLRDLATLCHAGILGLVPREHLPPPFNALDFSDTSRVTPEHARALWAALSAPGSFAAPMLKGTHSDAVVAADAQGCMATIVHSSNNPFWGATGLMVDGVSVHDAGAFQQAAVAAAGPGGMMPMPVEIGMVLKDGVSQAAFSSMCMGLHPKTVAAVLSMTDFDMDVVQANAAPALSLPQMSPTQPFPPRMRVAEGEFSDAVLDASGLAFTVLPKKDAWLAEGHWIGVQRDARSGALVASSPRLTDGQAAAY